MSSALVIRSRKLRRIRLLTGEIARPSNGSHSAVSPEKVEIWHFVQEDPEFVTSSEEYFRTRTDVPTAIDKKEWDPCPIKSSFNDPTIREAFDNPKLGVTRGLQGACTSTFVTTPISYATQIWCFEDSSEGCRGSSSDAR